MTEPPATPDATEIAAMIRRKQITALEAVDDAIARAEAMQPMLNFLIAPMFEQARTRAKSGALTGPFAGVPYLIKDMYDIEGVPTRWGARFTEIAPIPTASCAQVKAFECAGLVLIGKSALGEFGWLPTTEPLAFGPTRNPWDLSRTPGGSSGGSAAAVAAGVLPMADAADGGGSIRIPASACGLFGLKPSRRRLIGDQHPAGGIELTAEHCVSRSVRDSAGLFAAMERVGAEAALPPIGAVTGPSKRRLRVGYVLGSIGGRQPDAEVRAGAENAAKLMEQLGHKVEPTVWPLDGAALIDDFLKLYRSAALEVAGLARLAINPKVVALASLALKSIGLLPRGIGRKPDTSALEPLTLAMAEEAAKLPAGELAKAKAGLREYDASYDDWFARYDVILSPVLLQPPVPIGHIAGDVAVETLMARVFDFADYTLLHNIVGAPAMSVPLHWTTGGLPVGMQFAARVGGERTLFELAYELEAAQPWANRRPPIFAEGRRQ
ncbi:amidase [Methylocapsa sp. S129]|uniref:amidase n=1 Tax=Methylocapsa sp. S129 TaxID=1641869 RepID=UPI00131A6DB5|nr:amidase [Methylocapsa sp. S129]